MAATTTLKLPPALKERVQALVENTPQTAHAFMLEAIEHYASRQERLRDFIAEAKAADKELDEGGPAYRAEDVHDWLDKLATGARAPRPKPWRE